MDEWSTPHALKSPGGLPSILQLILYFLPASGLGYLREYLIFPCPFCSSILQLLIFPVYSTLSLRTQSLRLHPYPLVSSTKATSHNAIHHARPPPFLGHRGPCDAHSPVRRCWRKRRPFAPLLLQLYILSLLGQLTQPVVRTQAALAGFTSVSKRF